MTMKNSVPFMAMVVVQLTGVALMVLSKEAMATGMSNFVFIFYSNAISCLILLPSSFIVHRSNRPQLTFSLLSDFALLGILGYLVQIFGYAGIHYASATLASSMFNLVPGFTFILAVIFRMEKVDFKRSSTVAKTVGIVVSVAGAFIVALYKGPAILRNLTFTPSSNWVIGGFFLAVDCILASMFIIAQALILKRYPEELIVMFGYCFVVSVMSAVTSLIIEGYDIMSSWSLKPTIKLYAVLYAGVFGSGFQVTVVGWCIKRKGPLFIAMFHPLGIVIATAMSFIFLGESFYFGSLVGSVVIVTGFYSVMWGKSKEVKSENIESGKDVPLLC